MEHGGHPCTYVHAHIIVVQQIKYEHCTTIIEKYMNRHEHADYMYDHVIIIT